MAERKQIPIFESCYKITEYLKKNTDKDHPTTQATMRKDENVSAFLGAKETSNSYINQIALALNSNENGELLKELYRHPDIWVTRDENGDIKKDADKNILDLQMFFDILDGNNKNYPTPIYYGCDFGSESTSVWTDVYMLLRNQDKTKPLSADVVAKLIEIEEDCADY